MDSERLDCLLVVPNFLDKNMKHQYSNLEMLGPEYILASLKYHKYKAELMNAYSTNVSEEDIFQKVFIADPAVIGVTCASQRSYPYVSAFIRKVRRLGYTGKIVLGGFFASLAPEMILSDLNEIDAINLGEGEYSFIKVLDALINKKMMITVKGVAFKNKEGKIVINNPERITNLDFPFFPERFPIVRNAVSSMIDGKNIKGKYYNMIVGRGCYGRCSFCSINEKTGPKIRVYRSAKNIVDEIEFLQNSYGVSHIWFNDEIFYERSKNGRMWLDSFCNEMEKRRQKITFNIEMRPNDIDENELKRLKANGLTAVFVGMESGIQRLLDEMRKDTTVEININAIQVLKKLNIHLEMGWISLLPTMSMEELKNNYRFLFETECYSEENIYNRFNLYGGCYYEYILKKKGLLNKDSEFYERFGYEFEDVKVGIYADILEQLRGKFIDVKNKTTYVQERVSLSGDYEEYLEIRKRQRELWTSIVPQLINAVDMGNVRNIRDLEKEIFYEEFLREIKKIEDIIVV